MSNGSSRPVASFVLHAYLVLAPVVFGAVGVLAVRDGDLPDPLVLLVVGLVLVGMLGAVTTAAAIVAYERRRRAVLLVGSAAVGGLATYVLRDGMDATNPAGDAVYVVMGVLWVAALLTLRYGSPEG